MKDVGTLNRLYDYLYEKRRKRDELRWEALAYANHRTKEESDSDCEVPDVRLYSAAGVNAINRFVDGFMGNVMSRNIRWFKSEFESEDFVESEDIEGAEEYFSITDRRMYSELDRSNHYPESMLAFKDSITCAASAMFVQNDPKRKICVYKTITPWRWWADVDMYGNFDTFIYKFYVDANGYLEMFGDSAPENVLKAVRKNLLTQNKYEILQFIYPNGKYDGGNSRMSRNKKFQCSYLDRTNNVVVKESGYDYFPVVIHVYEKTGDSVYGTCPVMKYISEFRKLNKLAYEMALAIAKVNHGIWAVPSQQVDKFATDPDTVIPVTSSDNIPTRIDSMYDYIQYMVQVFADQVSYVEKLMYNDMFTYLMQQDKVLTATQVNAIKSEELSLLSSVFGNTQKEKIEKTLRLTFYLMAKNRRIPTPPKAVMRNLNQMTFALNSVLAQSLQSYSQRDANLANLEVAQQFAAMQMVEPMDNYNFDYMVRAIAKGNGSDARSLKPKREVEMIRAQRAQQQQQMMQQQQALEQSEMIRNLGGRGNVNNPSGVNQTR